ncbi:hypothetical protein QEH59_11155 [Coraliomargarita sp. SDUM461004]|uniref:DNA repair protein RecO n=1 Tax=Thalassobacterium sedimentorum TaxID=3041258 RepID=A0ABU1AJL6_9BACT|nr:hypothetical protein [Coraliomargarita sp. SDUM461004]MDQ8194986.1 hypothetical protein [Coraliomargarita sp. SDUM461004]
MTTKYEEALVLKTEPSGESFLKLYLLSAESGIFLCLKRLSRSKRAQTSTTPDLFDQASISLEMSQQRTMRFVQEYLLLQRREAIGQNYHSLSCAARLSQLLVSNASHMPESERLFQLTARSLDAFAAGKAPEVVLLKALYLLLKDEGYPVRESWWPTLRIDLRGQARQLLRSPAPSQLDKAAKTDCERIEQHLTDWMRHHTELIVPHES